MRLEECEQPGSREEVSLVGHYVAKQLKRGALEYVWTAVPLK
jgi:hypothetical protein